MHIVIHVNDGSIWYTCLKFLNIYGNNVKIWVHQAWLKHLSLLIIKKNVLQLFSTCQSQKLILENVYKKSKSFKHLSLKKSFYMLQYVCQK